MEASVATVTAPPDPEAQHDGIAEATRSTEELFEWSGHVHVGKGAVECEERRCGCRNPDHFHAWVCLPNSFQIRDIDDKARAAEARKIRALRDAGNAEKGRDPSDSYVTLEAALEVMSYDGEALEEIKEQIVQRTVDRQLGAIMAEMAEDERFKHHAQHAEEMRRLTAAPAEERDEEEYEQLKSILQEYGDAFQKEVDDRLERERAALDQLPLEQIIEIERRNRIKNVGEETYLHTYYTWTMYVCTFEPVAEGLPTVRKFSDMSKLRAAPPEVVRELRQKITALETRTTRRGDAAGN